MSDRQNQPVKSDMRTYNTRKFAAGPRDDYATGCLLDYPITRR